MQGEPIRILLPSITDPALDRGGAGAVTRAFANLLQRSPLNARIQWVFPASAHTRFHKLRRLTSVARSLVSALPAKAAFTYSRGFLGSVRQLLKEGEIDLVVLNSGDLLWLSSEFPSELPCILLAHNIEHLLFRSRLNGLGSATIPLRRILLRDWRRLQKFEIAGMKRVRNVIFLSSDDCEFALQKLPDLKTLVVPPLFDYPPLEQPQSRGETGYVEIGFLANFQWWPNREGLRWFLKED